MSKSNELSDIEKQLLYFLYKDSTFSIKKIAESYFKIPYSNLYKYRDNLIESGVIKNSTIEIDPDKIGNLKNFVFEIEVDDSLGLRKVSILEGIGKNLYLENKQISFCSIADDHSLFIIASFETSEDQEHFRNSIEKNQFLSIRKETLLTSILLGNRIFNPSIFNDISKLTKDLNDTSF